MHWIIDKFLYDENTLNKIKDSLNKENISYMICDYIPFIKETINLPSSWKEEDYKIVYGSFQLMRFVMNKSISNTIAFYSPKNFDASYYLSRSKNKENFLNISKKTQWLPFVILETQLDKFLSEGPIFVKPDSGNKSFTGLVLTQENKEIEINTLKQINNLSEYQLLLISEPKEIQKEYRMVVTQEKVLDTVKYIDNNEIIIEKECPQSAIDFVNDHLKKETFFPDTIFVLDVALLKDDSYKIIEYNALSTSDFYGLMDYGKIFKEAEKLTEIKGT